MSDAAEKFYGRTLTEIEELKARNAKLVAALEEARKYMEGYDDDHYRTVLEQIEEALNPTPR